MSDALSEFGYLAAPKVKIYRALMRFFYEQHLLQRGTIPPEDLRDAVGVAGYDLEQTLADLDALIAWGNVDRRRDTRRVSTLQEYARRRDLYYAKPRGLAIERFLEEGLDARDDEVVSPTGVLSRLEGQLEAITHALNTRGAEEEIELLWNEANTLFVKLAAEVRGLGTHHEALLPELIADAREG